MRSSVSIVGRLLRKRRQAAECPRLDRIFFGESHFASRFANLGNRRTFHNFQSKHPGARMTLLLGTDEAGYGPNLGPLVVGLTAWRIPPDCSPKQIAHRLRGCITDHECLDDPKRVPIADSKQLYQPARGLSILEQAVLAAWHV